jgi:hypothetical protein
MRVEVLHGADWCQLRADSDPIASVRVSSVPIRIA